MKKILVAVALASVFAACNNKADEQRLQASRDSIQAMQQQIKMDSLKKETELAQEKQAAAERAAIASRQAAASRSTRVAGYSESGYVQPQAVQKKGWSSAAKGAVIGAGAGALTGILVDKKNARGAVIGGVVGAGTGYAIGRSKDKKSGRNP